MNKDGVFTPTDLETIVMLYVSEKKALERIDTEYKISRGLQERKLLFAESLLKKYNLEKEKTETLINNERLTQNGPNVSLGSITPPI